jgi:hypothetical protein
MYLTYLQNVYTYVTHFKISYVTYTVDCLQYTVQLSSTLKLYSKAFDRVLYDTSTIWLTRFDWLPSRDDKGTARWHGGRQSSILDVTVLVITALLHCN